MTASFVRPVGLVLLNLNEHPEPAFREVVVEVALRLLLKQLDDPLGFLLAEEPLKLLYELIATTSPMDYLDAS